jgi:MFS family permease
MVMVVVFLFAYNLMVLLPLLAVRSFGGGAGAYGTLLSLFGAGSLFGALFMASRVNTANLRRLVFLALAVGGMTLAVALAPTLPIEWLLMPPLGAVAIAFPITGNAALQLTSSDEMRGRVMSIYGVLFLGSTPLGGPIAGWVGEHLGPRVGLVAGGLAAVITGFAAFRAAAGRGQRVSAGAER